jgi:glycosyltransferase involved in cell wall biosynthesis
MRVLHLTSEYPPLVWGGLGTVVGGLTKASARAGIVTDVLLVLHSSPTSYGHSVPQRTVSPFRQGAENNPVSIFEVSHAGAIEAAIRLARARRPDIVHIHPVELWPIARAIKRAMGIPVVYTVHSLNLAEYELGNEPPEILNLWHAQQELITAAFRCSPRPDGRYLIQRSHRHASLESLSRSWRLLRGRA